MRGRSGDLETTLCVWSLGATPLVMVRIAAKVGVVEGGGAARHNMGGLTLWPRGYIASLGGREEDGGVQE